MKLRDLVAACVKLAHKRAYKREIDPATLVVAVNYPCDTRRGAEYPKALCVIFTEYAGLSQYGAFGFWEELARLLGEHALYYEWQDGGTATIWHIL